MSYGQAYKALLGGFGRFKALLVGLTSLIPNLSAGGRKISEQGNRVDMTNTSYWLYDALTSYWAYALVLSIINTLVTSMSGLLEAIEWSYGVGAAVVGLFLGIIGNIIWFAIVGCLYALVLYFADKYKSGWNKTLVSILIILGYISLGFTALGVLIHLFGILGVIADFSIFSIFNWLLGFVSPVLSVALVSSEIGALANGVTTTVNVPQNGGYGVNQNPNDYWNNQVGAPTGVVGGTLEGLGAVNDSAVPGASQAVNVPQTPTVPLNKTDVQNVNAVPSSQPVQTPQPVQTFACPYCGKPITAGVPTCPSCGKDIKWN